MNSREHYLTLLPHESGNARLPVALLEAKTAVWRSALDALSKFGIRAKLVDWAGAAMANAEEPGALLLQATTSTAPIGFVWEPIASISELNLSDADATIANRLSDPALLTEPS